MTSILKVFWINLLCYALLGSISVVHARHYDHGHKGYHQYRAKQFHDYLKHKHAKQWKKLVKRFKHKHDHKHRACKDTKFKSWSELKNSKDIEYTLDGNSITIRSNCALTFMPQFKRELTNEILVIEAVGCNKILSSFLA